MFPNNTKLEEQLLSLMIFEPSTIPTIVSVVSSGDFYNNINKRNFEVIKKSYSSNGEVDIVKIEKIYVYADIEYIPVEFSKRFANELREISKKRSLVRLAESIKEKVETSDSGEVMGGASKALALLSSSSKTEAIPMRKLIDQVMMATKEGKDKEFLGLTSGYIELDRMVGGLQPGHTWLLGGYTNYGKTTVAISILSNLLKVHKEHRYLFCSLEMSREQIVQKIISNFMRKTPVEIRRGFNADTEKYYEELKNTGLEVEDTLFSVEEIEMKIREMVIRKMKPKVVFIDFIQNVQSKGVSEYERITGAILRLQQFAKKMEICIVVLSQVSNDSVKQKTEVIAFKGTGALSAVADITIQVIRNKMKELESGLDHVDMKLVIQKNRHGRGGVIDLEFDTSKGLVVGH